MAKKAQDATGEKPQKRQVSVRLGQETMHTIEQIAAAMNQDREVKKLKPSDVVVHALDMGLKSLKAKYGIANGT